MISIATFIKSQKFKYLVAGLWNTVFGYLIGGGVFTLLQDRLHIILIGVLANFASISMAFFTYKKFIFRTHGNWIAEYFRCYAVYGLSALISIFLLWITVDKFQMNIWLAQGLVIPLVFIISYFGHNSFTFKKKN